MPSSGPKRPRARSALTPLHFHYRSGLTPSLQNPYFYVADCATPHAAFGGIERLQSPSQARTPAACRGDPAPFPLREPNSSLPLPKQEAFAPSGPFCPPGRTWVLRYVVSRRIFAPCARLSPAPSPHRPSAFRPFRPSGASKGRSAARSFAPLKTPCAADLCRPWATPAGDQTKPLRHFS